eukprot:6178241-Pleurochrysis_carterae.AAC.1
MRSAHARGTFAPGMHATAAATVRMHTRMNAGPQYMQNKQNMQNMQNMQKLLRAHMPTLRARRPTHARVRSRRCTRKFDP